MAADGYIPDAELMQLIQQVVRQHASSFQPRPKKLRRPVRVLGSSGGGGTGGGENVFGKSATGITERIGDSAGYGTLVLWEMDPTGHLTETENDVTIYNLATVSSMGGTGKFLQAKRIGDYYFLDFEEC